MIKRAALSRRENGDSGFETSVDQLSIQGRQLDTTAQSEFQIGRVIRTQSMKTPSGGCMDENDSDYPAAYRSPGLPLHSHITRANTSITSGNAGVVAFWSKSTLWYGSSRVKPTAFGFESSAIDGRRGWRGRHSRMYLVQDLL